MTAPVNTVIQGDCRDVLRDIPEGSVDLLVMDPPYEMGTTGGGAFGPSNRTYLGEIRPLTVGIDDDLLELIVSRLRAINAYIWCNKSQLRQYLDWFGDRGCSADLLTWHKTNPTPACGNKYLSDTEYLLYFREPGVRLYGTYATKRKWYVSPYNKADKELWGHPTIKPLEIVRNIIGNSMPNGGGIVLDPFLGSGTTAVAARQLGYDWIGIEVDPAFCEVARRRIAGSAPSLTGLERFSTVGSADALETPHANRSTPRGE